MAGVANNFCSASHSEAKIQRGFVRCVYLNLHCECHFQCNRYKWEHFNYPSNSQEILTAHSFVSSSFDAGGLRSRRGLDCPAAVRRV